MGNNQKQSSSAMEDVIDFINSSYILDLSYLSDDDGSMKCETSLENIQNDDVDDPNGSELSDGYDQPLSNSAKTAS